MEIKQLVHEATGKAGTDAVSNAGKRGLSLSLG
jgi:hypothetical protein